MTTYPEPTLIFENPELTVRAFSVSEMDNSVYLITMRATGEQVLLTPQPTQKNSTHSLSTRS